MDVYLPNILCATPVIYMWGFRCITCVEKQVYYMCNTFIHQSYACSVTHVIHVYDTHLNYMCETCVLQVFYTCITDL